MRVVSLRRLAGLNCAKAMRDMRSPPNTAWGLRLETEASCSPDVNSTRVVTTLVVPTSMARPNFMDVVSPRSTAMMRRPNVVTVVPAGSSRRAWGRRASTPGPTSVGSAPTTASNCSRSEVWWCSSRGSATATRRLSTPESMATRPRAPVRSSAPSI